MDVWLGVRVLNQAPAGRQAPPWVCRGDGAGVCVARPSMLMPTPSYRTHPPLSYSGPSLGPSSESNAITLRLTPLPFSSLRIAFIHGRYHTLSLCITLRLNRRDSDFGSEGWGFKSLRAHHSSAEALRWNH